jgi:uncharacterized protein
MHARNDDRAPTMKLHLQGGITQRVTGTGPGWVRVNDVEHRQNLVLTPDTVHPGVAPGGFADLGAKDLAALLVHAPEIVLLGTGATQRFPRPESTRALTDAQVGVEVMDTPAACRTYNILVAEGRRVVALLLVE